MARPKTKVNPEVLAEAYAIIDKVHMSFGFQFRTKRQAMNITLEQLELLTGIPNGRLSEYERNIIRPGIKNATKMINALGKCGLPYAGRRELRAAYDHDKLYRRAGRNRR